MHRDSIVSFILVVSRDMGWPLGLNHFSMPSYMRPWEPLEGRVWSLPWGLIVTHSFKVNREIYFSLLSPFSLAFILHSYLVFFGITLGRLTYLGQVLHGPQRVKIPKTVVLLVMLFAFGLAWLVTFSIGVIQATTNHSPWLVISLKTRMFSRVRQLMQAQVNYLLTQAQLCEQIHLLCYGLIR